MKTLFVRKHPLSFVAILMAVVLFGTSCSKDKDDKDSGFPRTVNIEYKVSSTSGLSKADITFTNDSGGMTSLELQNLPFSKKFDKQLTEPEAIGLNVTSDVPGKVKLEIWVNGKLVKEQSFDQSPIISAIIQHTFMN